MIDRLKPYPTYKDSGVPWLGEVPEHWEIRRTKTVLRERNVRGFPNEPLLAATQTKGVIRKEQYENRTVLALKDLHLLKLVETGDFVISLRSFQGGIEYARERGIISPAYTILYPQDTDNHAYLAFLFKSRPYIENLQLFVTGIRQGQNIDYERLSRSPLPLPPLPEQNAIVRFLDYMDRRIRRVIRARQRRIKLLEEYKQALIHQAVTGRIDVRTGQPYPAYKPSGVEWLGEVPAHWETCRLKSRLVKNDSGIWRDHHDPDGTIILRSTEQTVSGGWKIENPARLHLPHVEREAYLLQVGDLVVTKSSGSPDHIGKTSLVTEDVAALGCAFSNFMQRLRLGENTDPKLVWYYLNSPIGREQLVFQSTTTTGLGNLNGKILGNCVIALPPLPEQTAIVEYLDAQTAKIDAAIAAARREIELLREYRTRLIADVVTGKLDVREVAAQLPEEPPEEEAELMDADKIAEGEATDDAAAEALSEEEVEP